MIHVGKRFSRWVEICNWEIKGCAVVQVFEIICCMFAIISINCICYTFTYIYICIYHMLVLFVFLHRYLNALVTHIHQYSPCDHFRSRFSTSSAPLLLADSEELILWDRNLVVSPTGWKHKTLSKRISNFNIPTYQLVQRGYLLFIIKLNMSGFTACFFHSNSWNLVYQSWQFKACQREWYGKLASLWLAEPGPAQDVLRQSEQVLILSWIYVPLKKS